MSDREQSAWRRHFRLLGRADLRADVDAELLHHLHLHAQELERRGLAPNAARDEAARLFGSVPAIRDACLEIDQRITRRTSRKESFMTLLHDIRLSARSLLRSHAFSAVAIACVAIGVAVTATIFGAVHSILVRPLPYPNADRLVAIYGAKPERDERGTNISYWDYVPWREMNRSFDDIGMWTWSTITVSTDNDAERIESGLVTANLFPLLGVAPLLGRHFRPEEERAGNERVILLSHDLWQRRYSGDRSIIGRTLSVNAVPHTVIGVMPPHFNFPERGKAWRPLLAETDASDRGSRFYAGAIGRLKDGATLQTASADLESIMRRLERSYPDAYDGWSADPITLRDDVVGDLRRPLVVFLAAVGMVLLIICANVANLMLARGTERRRELGIRVALGAARGRIVRHVLLESVIIAAAGGALGALLIPWGLRLFAATFPNEVPFYFTFGVDATVIVFAILVTLVSGILLGIIPAMRASAVDVGVALQEGSRGQAGGGGRAGSRVRNVLVVAELALSVMLLVGATLLIRSYRALSETNLGFDQKGLLAARVSLPRAEFPEFDKRRVYWENVYTRLAAIPGVEVVGSAEGIPFSGWNVQSTMTIEGRPTPRGEDLLVHYQQVSPDYFRAIGAPIVRGRALLSSDRDSAVYVGVVNEELVRRYFAAQDPLGKRMRWEYANSRWPWITIVGVVRDFRHWRLPEPVQPAIYLSQLARPATSQTLVLRTSLGEPLVLEPSVRRVLRDLYKDAPAYDVRSFERVVSASLWRQRLQGQVLGIFALMAMLLAAIGIYGVISYAVAQRTREMGVRMALGAKRSQVALMVLGEATRLAMFGVAIGITGALLLRGVVAQLLYGIAPTDPITFIGVPVFLAAVALLASLLPAQRATRVDPVVAMRAD